MTNATIRRITNGYLVASLGGGAGVPDNLYAATLPEVVYWLGRLFDPLGTGAPLALAAQPQMLAESSDPLIGQEAQVQTIASGGFLVRQMANIIAPGGRMQEVYCPTMDAVSDTLTQVYTPPPEPLPEP